jgi:hypothetical protein
VTFWFWVHPTAFVALLLLWLGRGEYPSRPISIGWVVAPVVLNSLLWAVGSSLFGWHFGGLGGYLYFWFVLPMNGALLGLASPQFLHSRLAGIPQRSAELMLGLAFQAFVLLANLAVLSRVEAVVGNVAS